MSQGTEGGRQWHLPRSPKFGWGLCYLGAVLLVIALFLGVTGMPNGMFVLGTLSIILNVIGGVWALMHGLPNQKRQNLD